MKKVSKPKTVQASLRLLEDALPDLDVHADELGMSRAKLMEQIIENWLAKHPVDDVARQSFNERCKQRSRKVEKMGLPATRPQLRTPRKSHFVHRRAMLNKLAA